MDRTAQPAAARDDSEARGGVASRALATRALVLVYLLLGALTLSPLLWAAVPPLTDYPNHLARMAVLVRPGDTLNYAPHWQLVPNLAMDLIVPTLAQWLPLELVGRLFIASTLVLLVLGTIALHRAVWGRVGIWPLASLLFLYNEAFRLGFLNFLFGLGLSLLCFSAWIATARWRGLGRLALFSIAAALLFLMHLFAFGIYGLLVLAYELGGHWRERRWSAREILASGLKLGQFVLPLALWLTHRSGGGPRLTLYGDFPSKITAMTAPMSYGALGTDTVLLLMGLGYLAWREGRLLVAPQMRLPVMALMVAAPLMPSWLLGSWGADLRLPIALAFVLIAATRLDVSPRTAAAAAATALLFLTMRVYALSENWREMDGHYAEFRAGMRALPQGARVLVLQSDLPESASAIAGVPRVLMPREPEDFRHLPALLVMDRAAFIPFLFTSWSTVEPTARNAGRYHTQGHGFAPKMLTIETAKAGRNVLGQPPYWGDWRHKYEFVLWLDFGTATAPPAPGLELAVAGSFFQLYRSADPTQE